MKVCQNSREMWRSSLNSNDHWPSFSQSCRARVKTEGLKRRVHKWGIPQADILSWWGIYLSWRHRNWHLLKLAKSSNVINTWFMAACKPALSLLQQLLSHLLVYGVVCTGGTILWAVQCKCTCTWIYWNMLGLSSSAQDCQKACYFWFVI